MRKNGWNQAEIDFLVNNAGNLTDAEVAEQLSKITGRNITRTACTQRRARLGLKKLRGRKTKNGGQRLANKVTTPVEAVTPASEPVVEQENHSGQETGHGQF